MLAGRKLLLADDSITIQKVVALTFADEGVEVLAVGNGADAVERLEEFLPDVVLADVYMPKLTGLQVCDHIKRHEKLNHIPVMLLVGSFEPFDEAEARRVGADDTLTKPFQSIRTLVEKVGVLLGREPVLASPEPVVASSEPALASPEPTSPAAESESEGPHVAAAGEQAGTPDGVPTLDGADTLEFPDLDEVPAAVMDPDELELVTADTRDLSTEIPGDLKPLVNEDHEIELAAKEQKMETHLTNDAGPELPEVFADSLLDLSPFEAVPSQSSDDIILELDFDSPAPEIFYSAPADNSHSAVAVATAAEVPTVADDDVVLIAEAEEVVEWDGDIRTSEPDWEHPPVPEVVENDRSTGELSLPDAFASVETVEPAPAAESALAPLPATEAPALASGRISLEQLSPEAIDAIARRVVEQLSEKAVQEIAWEVVPQLAELLIKRKLEESK